MDKLFIINGGCRGLLSFLEIKRDSDLAGLNVTSQRSAH